MFNILSPALFLFFCNASLGNYQIGDAGVEAIEVALQSNGTLFELCGVKLSASSKAILAHNKVTWLQDFWTPHRHLSFRWYQKCMLSTELYSTPVPTTCHPLVLATLLCNTEARVQLPLRLWVYIFSFLQRRAFGPA